MPHDFELQLLVNEHCQTGENPLWDSHRQVLYWADIPKGRIFEWESRTGTHRLIYQGESVGGFTLQADGTLLLFRVNNIALFDPVRGGEARVLIGDIDPEMDRFNDVIADPAGRVFAGTMGPEMKGGLYRVDIDGRVTCLFKGTKCANGMDFDPDCSHFYWTDTTHGRIERFRYDRDTGALTERHTLVQVPREQGLPDGLCADAAGNLWSARWGGSALHQFDPNGREIAKLSLPTANVSSVIFGGESFRTMFITTAGGTGDNSGGDSPAGAVFHAEAPSPGRDVFRSRVQLA